MDRKWKVGDWVILGPPKKNVDITTSVMRRAYGEIHQIYWEGESNETSGNPSYSVDRCGPLSPFIWNADNFYPVPRKMPRPDLPFI